MADDLSAQQMTPGMLIAPTDMAFGGGVVSPPDQPPLINLRIETPNGSFAFFFSVEMASRMRQMLDDMLVAAGGLTIPSLVLPPDAGRPNGS